MLEPDFYLLGYDEAESRRLQEQTQQLAPEAGDFLDRLRIMRGANAVDLGCGPRGVLDLLSERVGAEGTVIGVERSAAFAEAARRFIAARGIANAGVIEADAKWTGLPHESFDVVIARLLLVNVPEPDRIVAEMVALVRPGGVVASYEADYGALLCDPPSDAWDRLLSIYKAYAGAHDVDLFIGRKTHRLLRNAGLEDIEVRPVVNVYPPGHARRSVLLDFLNNSRGALVREGFAREPELGELMDALRDDLDDPGRIVTSHLFYEAFARKPRVARSGAQPYELEQ